MQNTVARLRIFLNEYIGLDLRSLALMRVLLSLVIISDLSIRFKWIDMFYGIHSVYPPSFALQSITSGPLYLLFRLASYVPALPYILFLGAGISTFFLLVGFHTRIASFTTWFFILALQGLNPLILQGGDDVMRLILFVGMFLPWGSQYSVDRALQFDSPKTKVSASPWTFTFLMQVCCIYFFAFFEKSLGTPWLTGMGVYEALSIQQFATPFSHFLYSYPMIMMMVSYGVRVLQLIAVILILSPFQTAITRTFAIVALIAMHITFALHLRIGIFSWICISYLAALIPTRFWQWSTNAVTSYFKSVIVYYDGDCGFCKKSVYILRCFLIMPNLQIKKAQEYPVILEQMRRHDSWVVEDEQGLYSFTFRAFVTLAKHSVLLFWTVPLLQLHLVQVLGERAYRFVARNRSKVCFETFHIEKKYVFISQVQTALYYASAFYFIVLIFWWNLAHLHTSSIEFPNELKTPMKTLGLSQHWNLFAPNPTSITGWYVLGVTKEDGTHYNVMHTPLDRDMHTPLDPSNMYPTDRWRKYFMNISSDTQTFSHADTFGAAVCYAWNSRIKSTQERARLVTLTYFSRLTEPKYERGPERVTILSNFSCDQY